MNAQIEKQIVDCMQQIRQKQESTFPIEIQKYAQLRLMDFASILSEWTIDDPKNTPKAKPLPNVAAAFKSPNLSEEQINKLLNYLQQTAKQGSTTAMLYLAYAYATGQFVAQNPPKAVECAKIALKNQDYRAGRLLGEMLAFAPAIAPDFLKNEVQAATQKWLAQHPQPEENLNKIKELVSKYWQNPHVAKFVAKQQFQHAHNLGSPTADKRLRGLSMTGVLPNSNPARQYQSIENYLETQLISNQNHVESDDEMTILPDHIPLMVQEDDEVPVWHTAAKVGGILLIAAMLLLLLMRFIAK